MNMIQNPESIKDIQSKASISSLSYIFNHRPLIILILRSRVSLDITQANTSTDFIPALSYKKSDIIHVVPHFVYFFFNFQIIVESHRSCKNTTENCHVPFTQFPQWQHLARRRAGKPENWLWYNTIKLQILPGFTCTDFFQVLVNSSMKLYRMSRFV